MSVLRLESLGQIRKGTYEWPHPLGLALGLLAVVVGQVVLVTTHWLRRRTETGTSVQHQAQEYDFGKILNEHWKRYESFLMLATYLAVSWEFRFLPPAYYSFEGGVNWLLVVFQLMSTDFWMYVIHYLEHLYRPMYIFSRHYNHHKVENPQLFDAFNGDVKDTFCMILVPLHITTYCITNVNVWTYMAYGSSYAALLMAIHSEYHGPLDKYLRYLGVGVPADHHVHHLLQKCNYGHLFSYWDRLFGTYRDPYSLKQIPTRDVPQTIVKDIHGAEIKEPQTAARSTSRGQESPASKAEAPTSKAEVLARLKRQGARQTSFTQADFDEVEKKLGVRHRLRP